jgi:hypothetical protein
MCKGCSYNMSMCGCAALRTDSWHASWKARQRLKGRGTTDPAHHPASDAHSVVKRVICAHSPADQPICANRGRAVAFWALRCCSRPLPSAIRLSKAASLHPQPVSRPAAIPAGRLQPTPQPCGMTICSLGRTRAMPAAPPSMQAALPRQAALLLATA